jgi:hypothetical protein
MESRPNRKLKPLPPDPARHQHLTIAPARPVEAHATGAEGCSASPKIAQLMVAGSPAEILFC